MRARAYLNLRFTVPERRAVFTEGLRRIGYEVVDGLTHDPRDGDALISWNRIHEGDTVARIFESRGLPVLVTENASWGNSFAGRSWYTLARDYHNVAEKFPEGGSERWDRLGVDLEPWREGGGETVILPSRGIGPACYRMPAGWTAGIRISDGNVSRVRPHPGRSQVIDLRLDLARCSRVITWGSAAAVSAMMWGIRVDSHMPNWIATQDNTDAGRLGMFRRLAWAQWTHDEIRSGEPFEWLLGSRA